MTDLGPVLLIDCGSSALKWAEHDRGRIERLGAEPHRGEPEKLVNSMSAHGSYRRVLLTSVLSDMKQGVLVDALTRRFGKTPEVAETGDACCGVTNGYATLADLGTDRWLAMIAAWSKKPAAQLVVDCGTAVTMDVIDGSGVHKGGRIIPGIEAMSKALSDATHLEFELSPNPKHLGHGTLECITSGIQYTLASAVDTLAVSASVSDEPLPIVLTGGHAARIQPLLKLDSVLVPDLVLEGLALWAGLGE